MVGRQASSAQVAPRELKAREDLRDIGGLLVTDVTGRQVVRVRLAQPQAQHVVDARHLEAGVYTVQLLSRGEQVATEKLIIQ